MNTAHRHDRLHGLRFGLIASIVTMAIGASTLSSATQTAFAINSTITGTVFEDFNNNGTQDTAAAATTVASDRGVAGVTVTAFDINGNNVGATTSGANGGYSLSVPTPDGPFRLEFSTLPAGYQPAFAGPNNGTSVQFVPDGTTANVNFGIINPVNYCQDNPRLATTCFAFGDNLTGQFSGRGTVLSYPYSATGINPSLQLTEAIASQTGAVYGVAYQRQARQLFVSAFTKRAVSFGPGTGQPFSDGTGTIYRVPVGTPAPDGVPFVDLDGLLGADVTGANPHTDLNPNLGGGDFDSGAFDAVGRVGLGGIDLSDDGRTLWVMNLFNSSLYRLPLGVSGTTVTPPTAAQVSSFPVPSPGCVNGQARPFAVKAQNNLVYVGGVCNEQASGTLTATTSLLAYVYSFDPAANAFSAAPVLQFPLNYPRTCADVDVSYPSQCIPGVPGTSADWRPWLTAPINPGFPFPAGMDGGFTANPQPMLVDIAFMGNDMIVGLRDRFSDQIGFEDPGPFENFSPLLTAMPAGDILRASPTPNVAGSWTLESNSQSVPPGAFGPTAGANTGQGPGNGEFFWGDDSVIASSVPGRPIHDETSFGSISYVPGFADLATNGLDPVRTFTGGTLFLNNTTGAQVRGYEVYPPFEPGSLVKANGLGDVVPLCDEAPLQLGNRVWNDLNGNGRQDPNEPALANVAVELTDGVGTVLASTTTAANGTYYFPIANGAAIQQNTAYQIRINTAQPALAGFNLTVQNSVAGGNGVPDTTNNAITDVRDSDAGIVGAFAVIPYTTGGAGATNHGLDFGFTTQVTLINLGNQVWYDTNNNGVLDVGEVQVPNVVMQLYYDTNADCIYSAGDTFVNSTTTGATGYYTFTNLPQSTGPTTAYIVVITGTNFAPGGPLNSYQSSDGDIACNVQNQNERDHGVVINGALGSGGFVSSRAMTLTADNYTYDFGFYRLALGNLVWNDLNNDGSFGPGESGIPNVPVRLTNCAGNILQSTTTDASGIYGFTGLISSTYCAEITAPPGYVSSDDIPSTPNPNNNVDNDDNGLGNQGGVVGSNSMALTPGSPGALNNNIVSNATGSTVNPTLDFGLRQPPEIPQLIVRKSGATRSNATSVVAGDLITYTLIVTNTGLQTANGVVITDAVPAGTEYVQGSGSGSPTLTNGVLRWEIGTLAPGQSSTVTFTVRVLTSPTETDVCNVGYVSSGPPPTPPAPPTPSNQVCYPRTPNQPQLVVRKSGATSSGGNQVRANDLITYTLTVTNIGAQTANGVVITDAVPVGSEYVAGSGTGSPTLTNGVLRWEIGTLAPGQSSTVAFTVRVSASADNSAVCNIGYASSGPPPTPPAPPTPSNQVCYPRTPNQPQLVVRKSYATSTGTNQVTVGSRITYTLIVTSVGAAPATGVVITDAIPAGTQYVAGSAVPAQTSGPNPLVWNIGTMNPGQVRTVRFSVSVVPNNLQIIRNVAQVGDQTTTSDSNETENTFNPNEVTLSSFAAAVQSGGVKVAWTTATERDTWGFFVLRSATDSRSDAVKVNAEIVVAKGANGGGASYSVVDPAGGANNRYWLQEIEVSGKANEHGPVTASAPAAVNPNPAPAPVSNPVQPQPPPQPQPVAVAPAAPAVPAAAVQAPAPAAPAATGNGVPGASNAPATNAQAVTAVQNAAPAAPVVAAAAAAAEAGNANASQPATAPVAPAAAAPVEAAHAEQPRAQAQAQAQTQQIVASSSEVKAALEAAPVQVQQPETAGVANAVNVVRGNRSVKAGELAIQPAAPEQQSNSALPLAGLGLLALALMGAGLGGAALFLARRRRSA